MGEIIKQTGKEVIEVSTNWLGKKLTLTVNKVGFRTQGSVLVKYGDTVILGSASSGKVNENLDYFPLSIDYEERFYASGKISSSRFIKREGRPSDEAILVGRLIDRPVRPLFPKGYKNETQVVATVLSTDPSFRPDALAMIAVSTALLLTGAPFDGPVAGLRVGLDENGEFKAFLSRDELANGAMDLFVAGREIAPGKNGVMMVEAGMNEVPENKVADAIDWALDNLTQALKLQNELVEKVGVDKQEFELVKPNAGIQTEVDEFIKPFLTADLQVPYPERNPKLAEIRETAAAHFAEKIGEDEWAEQRGTYLEAIEKSIQNEVRHGIIEDGIRPDGRKLTEIRPLSAEVDVLPKEVHGSSLFTRGLTQALNTVTLASLSFAQLVDTMEVNDGKRRYIHHYNAPGYTVGEIKRIGTPGRREIGHGYLAERALLPVLPTEEEFPYAIRSVTEIMSQNGSTSMAATCSSCMALMAAGVPIRKPVAGVAMGLMVEKDAAGHYTDGAHYVLTDLADQEDFAGDMDFKCTGTDTGITALQMDMKVHGLPSSILREALGQARDGRMEIMKVMLAAIPEPRKELSPFAPKVESLQINPDKIGAVIGKGGEVIQKITGETGVQIDIAEDGLVTFATNDADAMKKAVDWVRGLVEEPEVGKIYRGKVVGIKDFGAFVNILPGIDGMLHISQIADHRIDRVEDVLALGQEVNVRLTAIDDRGKLSLVMKDIAQ